MPVQPAGKIRLTTARRIPTLSLRVWDAPTRLFHWLLVLLLIAAYVTVSTDRMQAHFYVGYAIATLLLFRLLWGFFGSETSRFARFLRSPMAGLRHLAHFTRREPDTEIGHNAAGGWMVLLLLAAVGVQVLTGLFGQNPDDVIEGPFAHHLPPALGERLIQIHETNFWFGVVGLAGLHVLAVLAYAVVKGQDLVRPMVTGRKRLPGTMRQPRFVSPLRALALLVLCALVVWAALYRFG